MDQNSPKQNGTLQNRLYKACETVIEAVSQAKLFETI